MARKTTGADRPSSGSPVDIGTARGSRRAAAGVLLLGRLIFFEGVSRRVVGDWAAAVDGEAKRISIVTADADQFTLGFALMGLGLMVTGIALGLWGRSVTHLETGRRATVAVVLGLTAAIGGLGPGLIRIITPLIDVEQAAGESGALNLAYVLGAFALASGFGMLSPSLCRRFPPHLTQPASPRHACTG